MKLRSRSKLRVEGLWMIFFVAILGLPTSSWAQFMAPVRTNIGSNADMPFGPTFSGDMLDVVWTADLHRDFNIRWDIWRPTMRL